MTTLRRQRRSLGLALLQLILLAAAPAALPWRAGHAHATTTEQVVADHNTGLAIYGYDPVAYFAWDKFSVRDDDHSDSQVAATSPMPACISRYWYDYVTKAAPSSHRASSCRPQNAST